MSMIPSIYKEEIKQLIESLVMNAVPSGFIGWFNRTTAPDGWVVCDGTNGTPNLIGRYPLGAISNIGSTVEAGLPNITGQFNGVLSGRTLSSGNWLDVLTSTPNGAFAALTTNRFNVGIETEETYQTSTDISFAASSCSNVYGKSETVTPPSIKLLPCMKL